MKVRFKGLPELTELSEMTTSRAMDSVTASLQSSALPSRTHSNFEMRGESPTDGDYTVKKTSSGGGWSILKKFQGRSQRPSYVTQTDTTNLTVTALNKINPTVSKDTLVGRSTVSTKQRDLSSLSSRESIREAFSRPASSRFITQVFLLLWKNILLDLRRFQSTMLEVLFPTSFALVLLFMKMTFNCENKDAIIYPERDARHFVEDFRLGFFPETNATIDVIRRAIMIHQNRTLPDCMASRRDCPYRGFAVEKEALGYFHEYSSTMRYIIDFRGVNNRDSKTMPMKARFLIRPFRKMNQLWHTDENFPFDKSPMPIRDEENYPYVYIQTLLSRAVMANWRNDSYTPKPTKFNVTYIRFPSPPYVVDDMYNTVRLQLTLFEVLAYMLIAFVYTKNIVQEKENKLKESMKLIGLRLPAYWLSWCLTFLIFIVPTVLMFTLILSADLTGQGAILTNIDPSIIFFQLICYSIALISYSFLISTLVQKSSDGMIISGLVFLLNYVPFEVISQRYKDLTWGQKIASCLLFNVALGFSNFNIVRREYNGMGLKWEHMNEPIDEEDITMKHILSMLLVDASINALLTWYIDNVYPGDYGVPRRWNFFVKASYWCDYKNTKQHTFVDKLSDVNENVDFFEKKLSRNHVGIHVSKLTKRFGDLVSVNNLNLKMYAGEITVLLGHNGAGKTTTMSMLTGFIPPSDGTAIVNGYNIRNNIAQVRRSLGLCPQHDILYDALTPYEHLWFYSKLKGYHSKTLKKEIFQMLKEVGFENSSNSQLVSTMSAGQKRSLSVGIALIGDSKVVILDEPSSGMDPSTRRHTWDVLMKYRPKKTMLLTTHYMDEADALGDRIAILAKGELQCCGSSMFLKKLYGTGMRLTIEGNEDFNLELLLELMDREFPDYTTESTSDQLNICFLLPETATTKFPNLLRHLSINRNELGIINFGIKTTTMEEVFLKSENKAIKAVSGFKNDTQRDSVENKHRRSAHSIQTDCSRNDHGLRLLWRRCKAQMVKRYIVYRRNYITSIAQFILPPLFYLVYIFVDTAMIKDIERERPVKWFNINDYGTTNVFMFDNEAGSNYRNIIRESGVHKIQYIPNEYNIKIPYTENLTTNDVRQWILDKYSETSLYQFDRTSIVGVLFNDRIPNKSDAIVLYNAEAYHSLFIANQLLINSFVRELFNSSHRIDTGNFPLPKKGETELFIWYAESYRSAFYVGLFIGIGFCIYTSFFVYYLLRERVTGVKHMHAMFGVGMITYWLPTYMWDSLCFIPPTAVLFTIFSVFGKVEFLSNWYIVILVMVIYTWSILPNVYATHFLFEKPSSGLVGTVIINLFGVVFSDIMFNEFNNPKSNNKNIGRILDWIFSATIPTYNLSQCFNFMLLNYKLSVRCGAVQNDCRRGEESLCCMYHPKVCVSSVPASTCFKWTTNYFAFTRGEGICSYFLMMLSQGCVCWLIVFCIEVGLSRFACAKQREILPDDCSRRSSGGGDIPGYDLVEKEKTKVLTMKDNIDIEGENCLVMVGLHKTFGNNVAVDHIYATARPGQCLALLGQSGAGKTTLFRMLTGQTIVTSGNAYINGHSVRTALKSVQKNIGYCPQFDAHIPEMTAHETLRFYARLRGIPEYQITHLVNNLVEKVLLDDSANHKCGTYSGGNRRKLSLAIALVGCPPFILLDEPSSGMDPKARRQMWNVLNEIRECGSTIVMTSHSMEECEALSTKLAIMLNGRLLCMDTPQHLKHKFGQGYTVIIKEGSPYEGNPSYATEILDFIKGRLPETKVFDEHPGYLHLQIPNKNAELWEVFAAMEDCKAMLNIEDYIVNETTLEQIFLAFTKANERHESVNVDEDTKQSCWNVQAGFFDDKFWKCVGK